MITCTLGEKKYTVDYITGRALREMEPAAKMYAKIVAVAMPRPKAKPCRRNSSSPIPEAMDVMIRWFCCCSATSSPWMMCSTTIQSTGSCTTWRWRFLPCRTQTIGILNDFPTTPAATQAEKTPA